MAAGAAVLGGVGIVVLGLVTRAPGQLGPLLFLGATGLLAVVLGLRHPVLACGYLLVTTFFRLAIPSGTLPVDPFVLAFGGVLAATWLWARSPGRRLDVVALDPIACVMGLYVAWNLVSMLVPHAYPAGPPQDPEPFPVLRFVLIGTVMPLTMFLVGRRLFVTERALRMLVWSILAAAAYSAAVSVLQFSAPQVVWPRYIGEDPSYVERAVGVFDQPVVNGMVLIVGFLVAMLVASHDREKPHLRVLAGLVAAASAYAVYLTHTRVTWLSFALVVAIGAVVAKGFRAPFVVTGFLMAVAVVTNWSTFTSADRAAGGVASPDEVYDRLNSITTSLWAFAREPVVGWGIGRFPAVNTFHHQAWAPEIPWERGFGIASHLDSLGILVELGIVGLVLWLAILAMIYARLVQATRRLPADGMYGRALGLTALLCLVAQSITGLTVDLRYFDFPNIIVMLLAGAAIGWQREVERTTGSSRATVETRQPHALPEGIAR
ncbi:O-antigen ligase family protein [Geodermatophilus aquaeductus]|uniref:O-antigen ligase family protein n=1 Tax=Geodermatophilus aquaeductus TaxID=1564161 RepID=UPI001C8D39DF|nr:O-antigen ligase family protein [Geodermatophilus aquaeductus]